MNYIILDFEYNCVPYGWDRIEDAELQSEIIEIGAVKLDENFTQISTFQTFVKPHYYTTVNQKVNKITGITTEQINKSPNFKTSFKLFQEWIGYEYFVICAWGYDDVVQLNNHCTYYKLNFKSDEVVDVQKMFVDYNKLNNAVSLEYAVNYYSIEKLGTFHSAIDDAKYTASILRNLSFFKDSEVIISNLWKLKFKPIPSLPKVKGYNQCPRCGKFVMTTSKWKFSRQNRKFTKYCVCNRCNISFRIEWKKGNINKKIVTKNQV